MEIWLIQNGKQTGPFNDYDIRSRISDRQLDADDFAWHEGLPGWVKLQEIELFKSEFELLKTIKPPPLSPHFPLDSNQDSPQPKIRYLARRFWARWLDLMTYLAVWWLLAYVVGWDVGMMVQSRWIQFLLFIPWFGIEAWLLHRFGTTPGKWLLGIRVVNEDGTGLTLKSSISRSIRVWIAGVGFGWGLLAVLCQAMSWFTARKIGKPVWDYMGQHKITVAPHNGFKIIALIFLFFAAMQLQVAVRGPHDQENFYKQNIELLEKYPEFREFLDSGKQWHLPVKR